MIKLKSDEDIAILRENALLVSKTLAEVGKRIAPGVTTLELDKFAETFIRDHGAEPAFLGYNGFPNSLCVSVNSVVVHGIPSEYRLQEGDIVSIDCGTRYKGFCGDSAYTFAVGDIKAATKQLMSATKESLYKGIEQAIEGNRVGDISMTVQNHVEKFGFSVVREMVGHGIGKTIHERPDVPNYGKRGHGKRLQTGMVLCIEPMINMGTRKIFEENDGWTVRARDNKPAAHFELTVVVGNQKPEVISTFKYIEEILNNKK